jgi:uncharacterized integral membrane protein
MNWDRVVAARARGRSLFWVAGVAIMLAVFVLIAAPNFSDPMFGGPVSEFQTPTTLVLAVGVGGVLFGLTWIWRLYKAPTKLSGAHWRFLDR